MNQLRVGTGDELSTILYKASLIVVFLDKDAERVLMAVEGSVADVVTEREVSRLVRISEQPRIVRDSGNTGFCLR